METVTELLSRLEAQPEVAGVIRYGTDHAGDGYRTGDVDLFVVLATGEPLVESLHFDVGPTPVDLNLVSLQTLLELRPAFSFPQLALREGTIVFDRTGEVGDALSRIKEGFLGVYLEAPSEQAVAFARHGHRHLLDKLRGRLEGKPLLANLLLGTNLHWLIQTYLRVRRLPFRGEQHVLTYLREHDAELYGLLEAFYQADSLEEKVRLTETLTGRVLGPVGGAWQPGEVLAFAGDESGAEPLASRGLRAYHELFGKDAAG